MHHKKKNVGKHIFLIVWFDFVLLFSALFFPFLLVHLVVESYMIAGNVTNTCSTDFLDAVSSIRKSESVSEAKSQQDRQNLITPRLFAERNLLLFVMQDLREILSKDQQRSLEEIKPHSSFKENKK